MKIIQCIPYLTNHENNQAQAKNLYALDMLVHPVFAFAYASTSLKVIGGNPDKSTTDPPPGNRGELKYGRNQKKDVNGKISHTRVTS